jgi:hypothetical protein
MYINEARRNPEKNIKQQGHEAAVEFLSDTQVADDIDHYAVSMTMKPKLGINPGSEYNTPLGVYFYPADYYLEKKSSNLELPFMDEAPYIQILRFTGPVLYLNYVDYDQYGKLVNKIFGMVPELANQFGFNRDSLDDNLTAIVVDASSNAIIKSYGGYLWYILYKLSSYLSENNFKLRGTDKTPIAKRLAVVWNKLIRMLGYNVVVDMGDGIIHENERSQGLVANPSALQLVKTITNSKYSTRDLMAPQFVQLLQMNKPPEQYLKLVSSWLKDNVFLSDPIPAEDMAGARALSSKIVKILKQNPDLFSKLDQNAIRRVIWLSGMNPDVKRFLLVNFYVNEWKRYQPEITRLSNDLRIIEQNPAIRHELIYVLRSHAWLVQKLSSIVSAVFAYSMGNTDVQNIVDSWKNLYTRWSSIVNK